MQPIDNQLMMTKLMIPAFFFKHDYQPPAILGLLIQLVFHGFLQPDLVAVSWWLVGWLVSLAMWPMVDQLTISPVGPARFKLATEVNIDIPNSSLAGAQGNPGVATDTAVTGLRLGVSAWGQWWFSSWKCSRTAGGWGFLHAYGSGSSVPMVNLPVVSYMVMTHSP